MRTTLTLEEDVAVQLKALCAARGERYKKVVNDVLRAGIMVLTSRSAEETPRLHRTAPVSLGTPMLPNIDNIGEVLALLEGDDHR